MVMVTRSSYRKACESLSNSDISEKNIIPPWCSSRKVYERKPKKVTSPTWEIRSSYPLRENIWEYLYENSNVRNLNCNKRKVHCKQKHKNRCGKTTVILLLFTLVFIGLLYSLWVSNSITKAGLIAKVIPKAELISFFGLEQTTVSQECCDKMKYLATQLARAEELLRARQNLIFEDKIGQIRDKIATDLEFKSVMVALPGSATPARYIYFALCLTRRTLQWRRIMMLPSRKAVTDTAVIDRRYIDGAIATKGSATEEWGGRVALWGVVPLWRVAHPLDTILALRKPTPSDCWPLSGSEGEIIIGLPQIKRVKYISVEHVRPDTAMSAPKHFTLYGILGNDTWIKIMDGQYHHQGPAKQFYQFTNWNVPVQGIVFNVRSNHGNSKYTCIYRVHVYESIIKDLNLF